MFFLAGVAAGTALDYLGSLKQLGEQSLIGNNGQSSDPFSLGNNTQNAGAAPTSSGPMGISSETMNTLISAQSQAGPSAGTTPTLTPDQTQVYAALDSNGDGQLSQSEFEKLFGSQNKSVADAIFAKIDTNGDGLVSQNELAAGLKEGSEKAQQARVGDSAGAGDSSGQGDKTQTTTNADGSITTTITHADGSQVSKTTPAAASSGTNIVANNMLEQLIQRQAQSLMSSTGQSVSMNV
jgi:Ca2+-binding EF-hand superfamily protein